MSPAASSPKVVILDRDGTIVVDRPYLADPAGLEFLPGAAAGLRALHEQGLRLVLITNQSGVGRGLLSLGQLEAIHARLRRMMSEAGAPLEAIYFCPHAPEADCACRKPRSELLLRAAAELGFEPADAVVIGDKTSDIEFGARVGARTILIAPQVTDRAPEAGARPDFVAADLMQAAVAIRELSAGR
jgi:D-glycero-D-manno-heptose 1,7-bisphosphate phosphatase